MDYYINDIPLIKAKGIIRMALKDAGLWKSLAVEELYLDEKIVGRVTAEPLWAKISSPHYHASAMDGFAIFDKNTIGATPVYPISLKVGENVHYVNTGDALPANTNAVIPIEDIEPLDDKENIIGDAYHPCYIRIRSSYTPWRNVRPLGEDMISSELVLPVGHILRAVDLGAAAACGNTTVKVVRKPRIAILPTGTELIPIGNAIAPGKIIEFNSVVLAAQVNTWGAKAKRFSITADDPIAIRNQIIFAIKEHDFILLIAGSAAGSEDYSARVIESLGELLFHGVAIRPGHPVIFGIINHENKSIPIMGMPGYPVSCALTSEIFVEPIIAKWLGRDAKEVETIEAKITKKVISPAGDDDYLRVVLGKVGEDILAAPISRGAGVISSLVRADGIVIIPNGSQGLNARESVQVRLYCHRQDIEKTIFTLGSHDMIMDIIAQFIKIYQRRLVSSNVGSLGGLIAIERGEAHLAGTHLLNPDSGIYNIRQVKEYIHRFKVSLLHLVEREQGLMVAANNPMNITSLQDLNRNDITFVNRQRGSGTRVLLDYHLKQLGVIPENIQGYNHEEYTHLSVATAILSGRADCGLGIAAAADSLGLDFISLYREKYDLILPNPYVESGLLAPLMDVLKDRTFQQMVSALPGYHIEDMGIIIPID